MKKVISGLALLALIALSGKAMANNSTELSKPKNNNNSEGQDVQKPKSNNSYSFTLFNFFTSSEDNSKSDSTAVDKKTEKLKSGLTN